MADNDRDLGRLEGMVEAIHENTKGLPELFRTVERHDTELRVLKKFGWGVLGTLSASVAAWAKTHLGSR